MEEEKKEYPSYYAIIPADVRYDKNLKDKAKLLYGEITALSSKDGYCWATNRYFANLYGVSITTISTLLKNLADNGYIEIEIEYAENSKQILNRYIKIFKEATLKKFDDPYLKKLDTPIKKNLKDNNINNNNINNNNINKNNNIYRNLFKNYTNNTELQEELLNHIETRKQKKGALTQRAIQLELKELDKLTKNVPINEQEETKIKIVQQSIERGWTTFYPLQNRRKNDTTTNPFLNAVYNNQTGGDIW